MMTPARGSSGQSDTDDGIRESIEGLESRTDSLGIKLEELEKRVSDARTYVGWALGSVGLLISTITIVSGLKYTSELNRLTEFKTDLENRLEKKVNEHIGKIEDKSELIFLPTGRQKFDGIPILARFKDKNMVFEFFLQIKNIGKTAGNITFLKLYTGDDLPLEESNRGSDVPGFSFSRSYALKKIHIDKIPPGAAAQYSFNAKLAGSVNPELLRGKQFTVLASVYYGIKGRYDRKIEIVFDE